MKAEIGDILLTRSRTIFGRLIRLRNSWIYGKGHNWSHAAIITELKEREVVIYEALSKGFIETHIERTQFNNQIRKGQFTVGKTRSKLRDVKELAKKYEGRGYGFLDIAHIILYWIFGTEAKFLSTGAQRLICSEAVSRILYDASDKKINFEKEFMIPYDLIEPMHLWQSKQIDWKLN